MGLYRQAGSPYWHYRFSYQGRRIFGSTKQRARILAQKIFDRERSEYILGRRTGETKSIKLRNLVDDYLQFSAVHNRSHKDNLSLSKKILAFFGTDVMACEIKPERIEKYQAYRKAMKVGGREGTTRLVSGSTINREVSFLRSVFSRGVKNGKIGENPAGRVKFFNERERARTRYLSFDHAERLLKVCPPDLRQVVLVALRTGMRQSEIMSLRWQDVDVTTNQIMIRKSKSGKPRFIPLHPDVQAILRNLPRTSDFVFPNSNGGPGIWDGALRFAWESAKDEVGIQDFRFHDLRHTAASHLVLKGASLQVVAEILGHGDLRMTQRYAHLSPEFKAAAIALLPRSAVARVARNRAPEAARSGEQLV
jgi:integrase